MDKEQDIQLKGTPQMVIACIMNIASSPIAGSQYKLIKTSITIYPESYDIVLEPNIKIGTFRFFPLPNNYTQFIFEIPQNWDTPLGHFLRDIYGEFQRLGFINTNVEEEKRPLGFRPPSKE